MNVRYPKAPQWQGKFEVTARCVVPADAFCEYQDGPSPKPKRWFARADGKPFFFAGTWMAWRAASHSLAMNVASTSVGGRETHV